MNTAAFLVPVFLLLAAAPGLAQDSVEPDCAAPQTQADMTECAGREAEAADHALNSQYKATRAAQKDQDMALEADMRGAEKALVAAQRAWIAFRDAQCEWEGFEARGGTMEPMLVAACKARLTTERTKQLKEAVEGTGN